MRPKPMRSILIFYILLLSGMLFSPSVLYAEKRENLKWSVNFNNIAISEALDQLTRLTRIKINTTKPLEDRIKKSYQNQTINEILRDMLKHINHASIWSHEEAGVDTITIWVYEKSVGGDAEGMPVPRVPPQRRAIQAEQPAGDIVQQDRESETSNESEDQNASQDEEKEQESTRVEKEADDTSKADEKSDAAEADATEKSSETPSEEKEDSEDSEKSEGTESQSSESPPEKSEKNQ